MYISMYVCMYDMIMNGCYDLYVNIFWVDMHGKYVILNWSEYDTCIYMNANVAYVMWWKICGYHDSEKVMNVPCYENPMSYLTVHDYVPYDFIHVKGHV